ncbi:MAG: hypothetical protein ACFFCO_09765, partial [Promethearchaeota archaeon]
PMVKKIMEKDQFDRLLERLEMISRLLVAIALKEIKTKKEKIITLSSLGFRPVEIAQLLGITDKFVNARLSEARKEGLI